LHLLNIAFLTQHLHDIAFLTFLSQYCVLCLFILTYILLKKTLCKILFDLRAYIFIGWARGAQYV